MKKPTEKEIQWRDLSDYGDHMTIQEFRDCVYSGLFIPYDGTGRYATVDKESDMYVNFDYKKIDKEIAKGRFTHVAWYNK